MVRDSLLWELSGYRSGIFLVYDTECLSEKFTLQEVKLAIQSGYDWYKPAR